MSSERPKLVPPNAKPLIVNVVMNIEYWPFDRQMPRGIVPAPHGRPADPPDVPNFVRVEYGMRCGMPRIMDMRKARGIRASACINAQVADIYPSLAEAVVAAEWELVGHSWFQRSLKQSDDEVPEIRQCLDRLKALGATLAIFEHEMAEQDRPRIITFGLHPHIIGVPHIAYYFERALDVLMARNDVALMTSSEIGDWFIEADATEG